MNRMLYQLSYPAMRETILRINGADFKRFFNWAFSGDL
jgi:hypothetical protein